MSRDWDGEQEAASARTTARLNLMWAALSSCEKKKNKRLLEQVRGYTRAELEDAITRSITRNGISLVYELIKEVDFRGW